MFVGVTRDTLVADAWQQWPLKTEPRLIGLPFAVDATERLTWLHLPAYDQAASLARPKAEAFGGVPHGSVPVQTVRLERVLRSVPPHIDIVHLKTDCQTKDLEVLFTINQQLELEHMYCLPCDGTRRFLRAQGLSCPVCTSLTRR